MPLRYLFVDMNAFFASVEQQDNPTLRGKPVVVVPVLADSTCCIAASYEAKAFGVKTGTPVWEAKQKCRGRGLVLVEGRHDRYTQVHHQIVRAVGRCVPVHAVMSVDEMACKLLGDERTPAKATAIAQHIKREIRETVGDHLRCSIGVGPNVPLAKVAGDMRKPDGLTLVEDRDLPEKMYRLKLTDFPGIGPRMERRLLQFGVTSVQHLYRLTARQLSDVWGSKVHGERWYHQLRGEEVAEAATHRRTLGHSHVLPPELRTDAGAYGVLARLAHKAAARLRTIDYWAGALAVGVRYESGGRWDARCKLAQFQDTLTLLRALGDLWAGRLRAGQPKQVWLSLWDLVPARSATPSLFETDRRATEVSHVMDRINRAFGRHAIRFGAVFGSEGTAPTRVAFNRVPEFNPTFS